MTTLLSADDVRVLLRKACKEAGTQKAWAAASGVSETYLYHVLAGRREPSAAILKPLGLKRANFFHRIGK